MNAGRWLTGLLAAALAWSDARPEPGPGREVPVDLTPAFRIGAFTTSRYLFDKAWNQFTASATRRLGQPPGREEREKGFRLYLAQQLLKADLAAQGQLERPEVVDMTARMACYMLTQPRGPLYRELGGADPAAFHRERRAQILRESRFRSFPEEIARLWTALAPVFARAELPSLEQGTALGSSILAEYTLDGATQRLAVSDFVRDFRQGIARPAPQDVKSLATQVEDIVVAVYDLREARARGLDRTAQFQQDRLNFALNQALALHEQEVLAKQVTVSPADLSARYEADVLRRKTNGRPALSFEQVRSALQRQLLREKVEAWELEHLARHAGRVRLELDLGAYGLAGVSLGSPPAASPP